MTANTGEPATTTTPATPRGRIPADTLSNRLTLARKLDGLSVKEAVEVVYQRTGVRLSESSWSNWEAGRRPRGETDIIGFIAQALDVDFTWLLLGGPLTGPRGPRVAKRPGVDSLTSSRRPPRLGVNRQAKPYQHVRTVAPRPEVLQDSDRPISQSVGGRRAVIIPQTVPPVAAHTG